MQRIGSKSQSNPGDDERDKGQWYKICPDEEEILRHRRLFPPFRHNSKQNQEEGSEADKQRKNGRLK